MTNFARLTRPLSNVKNAGIFLLAILLSRGLDLVDIYRNFLAFLSLSLVCSGIYAFNSYSDFDIDQNNENKKHYAEAVKYFDKRGALAISALCVLVGLFLGGMINVGFVSAIFLLALTGFLYSSSYFRFKEKYFLDILFGAALTFPLRFLAAWYANMAICPPIIILFALAAVKSAGFMIYKAQDRKYISDTGISNSFVVLSLNWIAAISFALFVFSFAVLLFLYNNPDYMRANGLMPIPDWIIRIMPLFILPIFVAYFKFYKFIKTGTDRLRQIGFVYAVVIILVALALIK